MTFLVLKCVILVKNGQMSLKYLLRNIYDVISMRPAVVHIGFRTFGSTSQCRSDEWILSECSIVNISENSW